MFVLFTYLLYIFKTIAIFVKRNCGCFAHEAWRSMACMSSGFSYLRASCCGRSRRRGLRRAYGAGHGGRVPQYRCGPLSAAADCAAAKKYNLYGYGEKKVAKDVSRMRQRAARKVDVLPCVRYADRGRLHAAAVDASDGGGAAVRCRFRHVQRLAQGDGRAHGCELPVCAQPSGRDNRGVAACGRSRHGG